MDLFGSGVRETPTTNAYRWYAPRCWHGMESSVWWGLLRRHGFDISPSRWGLAATVSLASLMNTLFARMQRSRWGKRIAGTELAGPPIFIVGPWRSGTTLLHELLVQDPRFTYPDTYACFAPGHFLISRPLMSPWLALILPARRPMDNMELGLDRPQEDEFALMNLGQPSPYESLGFPNRLRPGLAHLDMERWTAAERLAWQQALLTFLRSLTLSDPRRIVLKSPAHTRRIEWIREVFPQAKFVHIVRHPYALYASMLRLWKSLSWAQGLQWPRGEGLEQAILESLEAMDRDWQRSRRALPPDSFAELRYEDLVADPVPPLRKVYGQLGLGGFERYLPRLERFWTAASRHGAGQYRLADEVQQSVDRCCAAMMERYGYTRERFDSARDSQ